MTAVVSHGHESAVCIGSLRAAALPARIAPTARGGSVPTPRHCSCRPVYAQQHCVTYRCAPDFRVMYKTIREGRVLRCMCCHAGCNNAASANATHHGECKEDSEPHLPIISEHRHIRCYSGLASSAKLQFYVTLQTPRSQRLCPQWEYMTCWSHM